MKKLVYVELKSGHGDRGPAWIGIARFSKSGRTAYFNGRGLRAIEGGGISGNFRDIETGGEYWVSGVKKNLQDRHWAGSGKIMVDREAMPEYLAAVGRSDIDPQRHVVGELDHSDVVARIGHLLNQRL